VAGPWVALDGAGPVVSFDPAGPGVYAFELEVDDGQARSQPARVTLAAGGAEGQGN
jgi:hypothetical protein